MKLFLQEQGCDVWLSVVTGYTATKKPLKTDSQEGIEKE
jgi:hypothetical protein